MATTSSAAKRTAVMQKYQALKSSGKSADTPANAAQSKWFVWTPTNSQWGISNINPWDVTFGTWSQTGQGSAYNMYPTWSYNTQFARHWDPLQTNNQSVNDASNQVIGQYAQVERALTPNISAYQDSAARLNAENLANLEQAKNDYQTGNANMQQQSDQYYNRLWQYLQSQQWSQEAFAANEAQRATGSQQAATAAWQKVWQTYVWQSLDAQSKKYAEDKALLNELTNYIKDYNVAIKWSKDEYDLWVQKNLLDLRNQLASSLANQQLALVSTNVWSDLNELAAQRAFVRQQALNAQQAALKKQNSWTGQSTAVTPSSTVAQQLNSLVSTAA